MTDLKDWRSQGDSNPCFRRERATSWAARRWEPRPGCSYIGASGRTQVVRLARVLARARAGSPEFSGRSSFGAEIALLYSNHTRRAAAMGQSRVKRNGE